MTNIWHTQWVHGFVTSLQILSFLDAKFTRRLRELQCLLKSDVFHGIWLSKQYFKKYYCNFCWVSHACVANLVTNVSVGSRAAWRLHTSLFKCGKKTLSVYLVYEKLQWPESWRASLHIYFFFFSQTLDFIYWTVLILIYFYIDLFWVAWHWKPAIQ